MTLMKFYLTMIFSLTGLTLLSQERIPVELKNWQLNLNILSPGVTFEKSLGDHQSLNLGVGLIGLVDYDQNSSINPFLRGSFRNYYPRKRVSKQLRSNSGNYVALDAGYYFNSITRETTNTSNSFFMGPAWGMQRNYQSGIHVGFSQEPGFPVGSYDDFTFTGIGQLHIGFVIK